MVAPNFPGQTPGQQGLQRLQKQQQDMMRRQREQAAWVASQRTTDDSVSGRRTGRRRTSSRSDDRLGFFRRILRGLFSLVFGLVTVGLILGTIATFMDGYTEEGLMVGVFAFIAFSITTSIHRWGRR